MASDKRTAGGPKRLVILTGYRVAARVVAHFKECKELMAKLKEGDKAPDFKLLADNGKVVSLKDFRDKKVILYFYPKDDTPGCTVQACEHRDLKAKISRRGAVVLGISKDSIESHKKFKKKYSLNFPLLSDPDLEVHKAYGAYGKKMLYGKVLKGIIRSSFVIDEKGKIIAGGQVRAKGNATKNMGAVSG